MENYKLSDILDLTPLQTMAESHYKAAGMPIGIIDAIDGAILVGAGWQDICVHFHRVNPVSLERCRESNARIQGQLGIGEHFQYKCKNGLWDIGIPIVIAGRHLASLFLGQFFYENEIPDRAFFLNQAEELGFDKTAYFNALDLVPVFSRRKVEYILEYNKALARYIADLAEQSLKRINSDRALQKAYQDMESLVKERSAELVASEELHRLVLSSISEAVFLTDQDGKLVYICTNVSVIFGYSIEEISSINNITKLLGQMPFGFEELETTGEISNIDVAIEDKQGIRHDLLITVKKVSIKGGTVLYSCRDITARKAAEKKLLDYQQQLKTLSLELLLVEEQERRTLASELHDRIGQSLALSKIKMGIIRESIDHPDSPDLLDSAYSLLEQVIQDVRTLTFEISPSILYELGLEAAIEWLVDNFRKQHGLQVELNIDLRYVFLDNHKLYLLFRIFRELLTNSVKHSGKPNVQANIKTKDNNVQITVKDNGVGFDASQFDHFVSRNHKYGLFSIRERVESLEGTFEVESEPGNGCRVMVSVPLKG